MITFTTIDTLWEKHPPSIQIIVAMVDFLLFQLIPQYLVKSLLMSHLVVPGPGASCAVLLFFSEPIIGSQCDTFLKTEIA